MTSKAAKAFAVMQHVSGLQGYDHALKVYEALGKSFGPVDKVLEFYDTVRFGLYDLVSNEEYWEMIEDTAIIFDQTIDHFKEKEDETEL